MNPSKPPAASQTSLKCRLWVKSLPLSVCAVLFHPPRPPTRTSQKSFSSRCVIPLSLLPRSSSSRRCDISRPVPSAFYLRELLSTRGIPPPNSISPQHTDVNTNHRLQRRSSRCHRLQVCQECKDKEWERGRMFGLLFGFLHFQA